MKKIFTFLAAGLLVSAQMMAVDVKDVCGQFKGELLIDWDEYPSRSVYLIPGAKENTLTFVLTDFTFGSGKLGNIVLPNIQMDEEGKLTLEPTTLWLDTIRLRASITMLNNYEDEGDIYNSIVSADHAEVTLEISEPKTLPMPIIVYFSGDALRANNYKVANGGFEGEWTNNEPAGWHSFGTATGELADFVLDNTHQFVPSEQVRPGSDGTQSAIITSNVLFGVKANGNVTNGRINAGSMTADAPIDNYNFSDPDSTGFNTPFHGRPDSLVFWAKYQPADHNVDSVVNRARVNSVITGNARYQDPESAAFGEARIASATLNYSATAEMGWQRLAVPFVYTGEAEPAYILTTFSTNANPGGGTSSKSGKNSLLDTIYIDDVELVYNRELETFTLDDAPLSFTNGIATLESEYCDSCAKAAAVADGLSALPFIAYDAVHKCIFIYVVADDYAQAGTYNLYRIDFTDSETEGLEPAKHDEEALEDIVSGTQRFEKVLFNGQLYLRSGNIWYNASGLRIR